MLLGISHLIGDYFRKLNMTASSVCFLIFISDCEVVSSKWSTWYVFINKEYWKYQLIRKQRSNYFVVINIHTSYFGLFNPDYFDIQCLSVPYLHSSISSNDNSLTTPNYDLYTADHQSNVKRGGEGVVSTMNIFFSWK